MTHKFDLTPEQKAERRKFLGGSEAGLVARGEWHQLWLEKTGQAPGVDLSDNLAVQLGRATEDLNIAWFQMKTGLNVTQQQRVVVSPDHPFMRATLDGWVDERKAVIDAKFTTGFNGDLNDLIQRYTPQLTHNALCSGAERGILSVIFGSAKWDYGEIEIDPFYAAWYEKRALEFWKHVTDNTPPPDAPAAVAPPVPKAKWRTVSMEGNNSWASAAVDWIAGKPLVEKFKDAEKTLKGLVEPDVGLATGHGLKIKRDGRGLKISEE